MKLVDIEYTVPDNIVPLDFQNGDAGATAAAHQALARFEEPVSREDAQFQEEVFKRLTGLVSGAEADECFILVPPPPGLGLLAYIVVRYHVGEEAQFVHELVTESTGGNRFVLEDPDVSTRQTPLGTATRNLVRWSREAPVKKRFGRKTQVPVLEQLSWYWPIQAPGGEPIVINLTAFTHDLGDTPVTRPTIDGFAEAITVE
jgi:hypothetical protein